MKRTQTLYEGESNNVTNFMPKSVVILSSMIAHIIRFGDDVFSMNERLNMTLVYMKDILIKAVKKKKLGEVRFKIFYIKNTKILVGKHPILQIRIVY